MPDFIELRGIRAFGRHGALPGERDHLQPFDLELRLEVDIAAARRSDELDDTVDYAAIHARIVRVHDVAQMRDVAAVADAIVRGWRPRGWHETL